MSLTQPFCPCSQWAQVLERDKCKRMGWGGITETQLRRQASLEASVISDASQGLGNKPHWKTHVLCKFVVFLVVSMTKPLRYVKQTNVGWKSLPETFKAPIILKEVQLSAIALCQNKGISLLKQRMPSCCSLFFPLNCFPPNNETWNNWKSYGNCKCLVSSPFPFSLMSLYCNSIWSSYILFFFWGWKETSGQKAHLWRW